MHTEDILHLTDVTFREAVRLPGNSINVYANAKPSGGARAAWAIELDLRTRLVRVASTAQEGDEYYYPTEVLRDFRTRREEPKAGAKAKTAPYAK